MFLGYSGPNLSNLLNSKTRLSARLICYEFLVQQIDISFHSIGDEVSRWRRILEVPYQEYLLNK